MSRTALSHSNSQQENTSSNSLRVGDPNSSFEREADRFADQVMTGESHKSPWSLSRVSLGQTLQRKCGCKGSSDSKDECDDCKKKKLLQRKPAALGAPHVAPPIVHSVLNSSGRSLDHATRSFFEPRLGVDLGSVQVHDDGRAARSAEAVNAHAYTVGNSIVFGEGRYQPESAEGRRLLAHELTHVVHQQGPSERLVQREEDSDVEVADAPRTGSLIEKAFDAADAAHWEQAAELANGLSAGDLKAFIGSLGAGWKTEQLHIGAISNARVGPGSAVAKMTHWAFLNAKFSEQMKGGFYQAASEYLNGFSQGEIRSRISKMKTEVVAGLHSGAVAQPGIGADSNAAKITGEELDKRKEKGDAAADAATKAAIPENPQQKKKRCQDTAGQGFKIFPLRLPKGMWQLSNAPIGAERKGDEILVKQPLNDVKGDPMFRRETKTLPLETFLGGIRLKKDEVVGVRLYDDKERLVCVTGEDMLKFNDATEMALWFSVGRTALDAATIFAPGASAGASKVTGFAVGNIVAGELLDVGRQEMEVKYGLREEVDWGGIAFDTVFQLATLGFSKYLNNAATKAVLGKAPELGQKPAQLAVHAALAGATNLVQTAARTAFDMLRKEKKKFVMEDFLIELAQAFATGTLFAFVHGAAVHEEGLPQEKQAAPSEHQQGAPPVHDQAAPPLHDQAATPVHDQTAAPVAKPQKKTPPVHTDEHVTTAPPDKAPGERKGAAPLHEDTPPATTQKRAIGAPPEEHAGTPSAKKTDGPEGQTAAAVQEKDATAKKKTADGKHDVVVTEQGVGKCSPPPCPVIHVEYKKELDAHPEFKEWNESVQNMRKADPEFAAEQGKKLIAALEDVRANGGKLSGEKLVQHREAALQARLAEAEGDLHKARWDTIDYQAERAATGKSRKGGPIKGLWNVKERIWAIKRQMAYPNRTILEQAHIVGVRAPDGTIKPTNEIGKGGRIPDYVEVRGQKIVAGDLKSGEEFKKSIAGGLAKPGEIEAEFRKSAKIAQQQGVEDKVLNAAKGNGGKIVIEGFDVTTGEKVVKEVDPADYGSEVITYDDVRTN
ncbi:hypothetical protein Acid345_0857 [Candidatus Koribacter versatilis Ellin345]|uniref:DUF4157 domain-containing protein n=1 Tax=Koribacter versatilis (strain Ellin345) TaxID=204669 RepID=Q1ITD8_KORVE|nr:DUF4157 domain-containing protein [Candidatus Koribacter versatilis]ABF39862.1 hypothetical protein Acid345_0857 [Candidatus Koribacter versatilis Ellin345]